MQGDPKFVVYFAIDKTAEFSDVIAMRPNLKVPGGMEPYVPKVGEDKEICQFAVEVPHLPIAEKQFRSIFDKAYNACLERARSAGLVVS